MWAWGPAGPGAASFQEKNSIAPERGQSRTHWVMGEKGWVGGGDDRFPSLVPAKENSRWRRRAASTLHPGLSPTCRRLCGVGWDAA